MLHKWDWCSIHINSNFVDWFFNNMVQWLGQLLLVHVVLVLANSDGFRVYFHKLCKRILKPPGYWNSASLSYIVVRKLFCSQFACRIYACPSFVHYHILDIQILYDISYYLFGLPWCCSVSNCYKIDVVFENQIPDNGPCLGYFVLRLCWKY